MDGPTEIAAQEVTSAITPEMPMALPWEWLFS
jgi:hypothetical protein